MNKDEILKKAQSNNQNNDEMSEKTHKLVFRHFEIILVIPLVVFGFVRLLNQESVDDLWAILFGIEAVPSIITGVKDKRPGILIAGLVMLLFTVLSAASFFKSYMVAV